MDGATTAKVLAALGHEGRLTIFRLLASAGPGGLPAGEIARRAGHLQNTTSTHLSVLSNVGLIVGRRDGRSIIYSATHTRLSGALDFAMEGFFDEQTGERTAFFQRLLNAWDTDRRPPNRADHRDHGDAA